MTARKLAVEGVRAMGQSQALAVSTQSLATHAGLTLELVIAGAAPEQAHVALETDKNLVNIQDFSSETAAGANRTSASTQGLLRQALSFRDIVGKFRLLRSLEHPNQQGPFGIATDYSCIRKHWASGYPLPSIFWPIPPRKWI